MTEGAIRFDTSLKPEKQAYLSDRKKFFMQNLPTEFGHFFESTPANRDGDGKKGEREKI